MAGEEHMSGDHNAHQNDFHPDWICTCGDLTTLGIVHRQDGPCYYPYKRPWVSLTDDDINAVMPYCHNEFDLNEFKEFARSIEKKLKDRNT
jgi:hypothetical protein